MGAERLFGIKRLFLLNYSGLKLGKVFQAANA
jgi:hypothetical protein